MKKRRLKWDAKHINVNACKHTLIKHSLVYVKPNKFCVVNSNLKLVIMISVRCEGLAQGHMNDWKFSNMNDLLIIIIL